VSDLFCTQFDQYQRYRTAARVIQAFSDGEPLDILEVGANVHRNLERFAPGHRIIYLDRDLPDEVAHDPAFVKGDATAMPFEDRRFDLVVCVDVFEHIPAAQRMTFVHEVARVSRRGLILGAPFDTPGVHAVEQSANGFYRVLSGLEHPWLREHLDNGLPDLAQTRAQLESLGLQVETLGHGEIGLWLALTQAHLAENVYPDVAPKVRAIYRMYAREVYPSDVRQPCYRHFLFAGRDPAALSRVRAALAMSPESPIAEDLRQVADGIALTTAGLIARQRGLERATREHRAVGFVRGCARVVWRPAYRVWRRLTWLPAFVVILRRSAERSGWRHAAGELVAAVRGGGIPGLRRLWTEQAQPLEYARWIAHVERAAPTSPAEVGRALAGLSVQPRFLLVLDCRAERQVGLQATLASIRTQTYPEWSLLVLCDDGTAQRPAIDLPVTQVQVVAVPGSSPAGEKVREAIGGTHSEFVIHLRPGVILRPHALLTMAEALDSRPGCDVLYSDEDRINVRGSRYDPWFKPEWDPELILGQDYLGPLTAIRASSIRDWARLDHAEPECLSWGMKLEATSAARPRGVVHLPGILCHVKDGSASAAGGVSSEAVARMLQSHFAATGVRASVEPVHDGGCRIRYALPDPLPLVSIIVPTRNALQLVRQCVESIRSRTTYDAYEIVLVDNQSDDPATLDYFAHLSETEHARVLRYDAPFNYSAINNFAVRQARAELLCLMNNDTEVISPGWLDEMASLAMRPGTGAVGAMLYYPNETIQHAGVELGLGGGLAGHRFVGMRRGYPGPHDVLRHVQTLSAVTAACLVIRKTIYEETGGLDETDFVIAYNDVDFCLRVQARGYRNVWTPFAELYHHETATRGHDMAPERLSRYKRECDALRRRWGDVLTTDPASVSTLASVSRSVGHSNRPGFFSALEALKTSSESPPIRPQ
jgi:GT2 family glycosyltransferase